MIENREVNAIVDSGATSNFISERIANEFKSNLIDIKHQNIHTASKKEEVFKKFTGKLKIGERSDPFNALVFPGDPNFELILGQQWLIERKPNIDWETGVIKVSRQEMIPTENKIRTIENHYTENILSKRSLLNSLKTPISYSLKRL